MKKRIVKYKFICIYIFLGALMFVFLCFLMFTEVFGKPIYFFISYPSQNKIIKINNYDDLNLRLEISSKFDFENADAYLCYKNAKNIKYINNIENVFISSNMISNYENINFIDNSSITQLNISTLYSNDWSAINSLKKLTKICLSDVNISDMSIFNEMTNLQSISISSSNQLLFSNINLNDSIEYLEIKTVPNGLPTENISGISNYINIKTLYLINTNICDISELSRLTQLEDLYIDNRDNDYSSILEIPNLKQLHIKQDLLTKEQIDNLTENGVIIKDIS